MIFVTVGTHEQPFDRLVRKMDDLVAQGAINEEVIIQTGYCNYEPKHCTWQKLYPYKDMLRFVEKARIVITHGGPSSFIMPLQIGKIPIVVPRQVRFGEHINNHQVEFCERVAKEQKNIIVIENTEDLEVVLHDYDEKTRLMNGGLSHNNDTFCRKFEAIVNEVLCD